MKPMFKAALITLPIVALGIQLIRVDLTNPPVVREPAWDSPQTRDLARRACMDCHGNETRWPWYSQVAPVSWLVSGHVNEAREHLNFSAIDGSEEADEMIEEIRGGEMPTWDYKLIHAEARLSPAEQDSLVAGLQRTFAESGDSTGVAESGESAKAEHDEGHEDRD